jgi:hypothetical protein
LCPLLDFESVSVNSEASWALFAETLFVVCEGSGT